MGTIFGFGIGINTVLVIAAAALWYIKIYRPKHARA